MTLTPSPVQWWFIPRDIIVGPSGGLVPAAGYKFKYYNAGTWDAATIYQDANGTPYASPSNTAVLNSSGYATVFLAPGGYKFQVTDASDVQVFALDNITGGGIGGDATAFLQSIIPSSTSIGLVGLASATYGFAYCAGYYGQQDGGGDLFFCITSSAAADGGYCFAADDTAKRWFRIPRETGVVNSLAFGCIPSNSVDRTTALQAADAYAATNKAQLVISNNQDSDLSDSVQKIILAGTVTLTSGTQIIRGTPLFTSNSGTATLKFTNFIAPPNHIFASDVTINFLQANQNIFLEWFGGVGDASTDDSAALVAAASAIIYSGAIELISKSLYEIKTASLSFADKRVRIYSKCYTGFIMDGHNVAWKDLGNGLALENISFTLGAYSFKITTAGTLTALNCAFNAPSLTNNIIAFTFDCMYGFLTNCYFLGIGQTSPSGNTLLKISPATNPNFSDVTLLGCILTADENGDQTISVVNGLVCDGAEATVRIVGGDINTFTNLTSETNGGTVDEWVYSKNGVVPGPLVVQAGSGTGKTPASGKLYSYINLTGINTSGTGATNLYAYTLPKNTILNVGDELVIRGSGSNGGGCSNPNVSINIAGVQFFAVTGTGVAITNFTFEVHLIRGSTYTLGYGFVLFDNSSAGVVFRNQYYGTAAFSTYNSDAVIQVIGQVASGTLTQNVLTVELLPAPV